MTDYWPSQEGVIVADLDIGFAFCNSEVELHEAVHLHTSSTAGRITIAPASADGDGYMIALEAGAASETISVMLTGIIKLVSAGTLVEGDMVMNAAVGTTVLPIPTITAGEVIELRGINYTGTMCRLGISFHDAVTGDEVLIAVGKFY